MSDVEIKAFLMRLQFADVAFPATLNSLCGWCHVTEQCPAGVRELPGRSQAAEDAREVAKAILPPGLYVHRGQAKQLMSKRDLWRRSKGSRSRSRGGSSNLAGRITVKGYR